MGKELAKKLLRSFAENLCGDSDPERVISALETCTEFGEDFYSTEEKSVSDRAYYLIEGVMEVLREKLREHGVDVRISTNVMSFIGSDEHECVAYDPVNRYVITVQHFKGLECPFTKDSLVDTVVGIWNDSVKSVKRFYGVELSPITVENPEKLFDETVNELERELELEQR